MSKDVLHAIALGIGGLVVALVLTGAAFAIAGQDISEPAGVPILTVTPSPSTDHQGDDSKPSRDPRKTASPSVDDHGGGAGSADEGSKANEGPDDHGSASGSGSGSDDHGGSSGSQESGSNSGSGSISSSGPGSGSGSGSGGSSEHGDD